MGVAIAARPLVQVVFQIAGAGGIDHGVDGGPGHRRPAQIGMQHRAGQVEDPLQRRPVNRVQHRINPRHDGGGIGIGARRIGILRHAAAQRGQHRAHRIRDGAAAIGGQRAGHLRMVQHPVYGRDGGAGRCGGLRHEGSSDFFEGNGQFRRMIRSRGSGYKATGVVRAFGRDSTRKKAGKLNKIRYLF